MTIPATRFSRRPLGAATLLLAWLGVALPAQELVADLTPPPSHGANSTPRDFVDAGLGFAVFSATTDYGTELWRTDLQPGGTWLLEDLYPDVGGGPPREVTVIRPGLVFFLIESRGMGVEPHVTDGTSAGTLRLGDLLPGPNSSGTLQVGRLGNQVLFNANDGVHGDELWISDGTSGGTQLLADLHPGPISGQPRGFTLFQGRLWFSARDAVAGFELWSTDGTAAGTRLEIDVVRGAASSAPKELCDLGNGQMFFAADHPQLGVEAWITDGTPNGTQILADANHGPASSNPSLATATRNGGRVFFRAQSAGGGQLWTSDGTPLGTRLLPIRIGAGSPGISQIEALPNRVVFDANDGIHGSEPWVSNGTIAGTQLLADLEPGTAGSVPRDLVYEPTRAVVAFSAQTSLTGREGFVTNGTTAGTQLWFEVEPGPGSGRVSDLAIVRNAVVFGGARVGDPAGLEPYAFDPASGSVRLIHDVRPTSADSNPNRLLEFRGHTLFVANGTLHSTNIVTGRTHLLTTSVTGDLVPFGGEVWFTAAGPFGAELWRTSGPTIALVGVDIVPGLGSVRPRNLVSIGNRMLFLANDGTGFEPWSSDGTTAGTMRLADINPGPSGSMQLGFVAAGNRGYFIAQSPTHGRELWVTDGTSSGTQLVRDINPGPNSSQIVGLTAFGTGVAFRATDGTSGTELWSSDGTTAGTVGYDAVPGAGGLFPRSITAAGDRVFFLGTAPGVGSEPHVLEGGLQNGVVRVAVDLTPGGVGSVVDGMVADGRDLVFLSDFDASAGWEPYRTDGTAAGTFRLQDVAPGPLHGVTPGSLARSSATEIAFAGWSGNGGLQLWTTDGTPGGTRVRTAFQFGLNHGAAAIDAHAVEVGSGELYVVADGPGVGRELFVVRPGTTRPIVATYGQGCPGSSGLVPQIRVIGRPTVGNPDFGFALADAAPGNLAILNVGLRPQNVPLPPSPCTSLIAPPLIGINAVSVDIFGGAAVEVRIPDHPSWDGFPLYAQWGTVDPGGALFGLGATSAGLQVQIGR
ncbi:MAG: hypothetical protein NXI31_01640 [bacterium]|nr:hypothetical protein [bacterium]